MRPNSYKLFLLALFVLAYNFVNAQVISTYAGIAGDDDVSGDGGAATAAHAGTPTGVAVDASGNVYFTDNTNNVIRKINSSGIISTIAGNGTAGSSGDGGAATAAEINSPSGICVDHSGNIYFADQGNYKVRKINTSGVISTVAGTGTYGYSGDGGTAVSAKISAVDVAISLTGILYIADGQSAVRAVSAVGIISTLAGAGGSSVGYTGDGGAATAATLNAPTGVAVDHSGNVFIADNYNNVIRKVSTSGIISTVAGNGYGAGSGPDPFSGAGSGGYSGDGSYATDAYLNQPNGIAVDLHDNLYIADEYNFVIRYVSASTGYISTYAGTGSYGYSGDGGPATAAELDFFDGTSRNYSAYSALDAQGNLYIGDYGNDVIRKVTSSVVITTASDTVCEQASVSFNAATTVSGTVHYHWYDNGASFGSDASSVTADSVHNSDTIKCIVTLTATTDTLCISNLLVMTVKPLPFAGTITGATSVCTGANITLSDATTGGTWSSSATAISTVTAVGVVHGVSTGSAIISYTVTNSCGSASDTQAISVITLPSVAGITGGTTVCPTVSTTLTDGTSGGSWSSVTTTVATVTAGGVVTGVSGGTSVISYTVTNSCGSTAATTTVTVNPAPVAGTIVVPSAVCPGATITLSDPTGTTGGTWTSATMAIATINSGTGVLRGVTAGTATISYEATTSCGTAYATASVTVNSSPVAGSISVPSSVCPGSTITLTDATGTTGGTWTSASTGIATINSSSGVLGGVAGGTATISYAASTVCGTVYATATVTVNSSPVAGTISVPSAVCPGNTITLTDATGTTGGTWTSASTATATINSASGLLRGISTGTATISYAASTVCGTVYATASVTVSPLPAAGVISGTSLLCLGATNVLTETVSGGNWTSSAATVASVSGSTATTGSIHGVSAGSAIITYTYNNSCGSADTTFAMTVMATPTVPAIGFTTTSVCPGATITLTDTASGGSWSSSNTARATVNSSGVVTGVTAGTDTIKYAVTNSCGTTSVIIPITISPTPVAGTISVPSAVCPGSTITLTDATGTTGGTWTSTNTTIATINSASGLLRGVNGGVVTISYTATTVCGSVSATASVTVNPAPHPSPITGSTTVCHSDTLVLSDTASGGSWTSSNTAVATINSVTGVVHPVASSGSTIITYSVTNSCGTATVSDTITVNNIPATPSVITGGPTVCRGSTTTLSDVTPGGVWSISDTSVATISSSGVVSGIVLGFAIDTYTVTSGCGPSYVTDTITVITTPTAPAAISGPRIVCIGDSITLADGTPGGTWSSEDTALAVVSSTGIVTGVRTSPVTITYTVTNMCGSANDTQAIFVPPVPSAGTITGGPGTICIGSSSSLSDAISGGTWISSNTSVATIASVVFGTATITGLTTGTSKIQYYVVSTYGCGTDTASFIDTVIYKPSVPAITAGTTIVCPGASISLTDGTPGGSWSSSNALATVSTSGMVTGAGAGIDTISYMVSNTCGDSTKTISITINPAPNAGSISGPAVLCGGSSMTYTDAIAGTWSLSDTSKASINTSGNVLGRRAGVDTVQSSVTNSCGTATATLAITIDSIILHIDSFANPTTCSNGYIAFSGMIPDSFYTLRYLLGGVADSISITANSSGDYVFSSLLPNNYANITTLSTAGCVSNSLYPTAGSPLILTDPVTIDTVSTTNPSYCGAADGTITINGLVAGAPYLIHYHLASSGVYQVDTIFADATGKYTMSGRIADGFQYIYVTIGHLDSCRSNTIFPSFFNLTDPPLPAITGGPSVCAGHTIHLSDTVSGGTWTSTSTGIATVDGFGVVNAISSGTTVISYFISAACNITDTITVNDVPVVPAITGIANICPGATDTLHDAVTGGTWTSITTTVATVGSTTGIVTGVSVDTATINYAVTNTCGTTTVSAFVPVIGPPTVPAITITGSATICIGDSVTLHDTATSGNWTSATPGIATITSSGVVKGVSRGIATLSYTKSNACGSTTMTTTVTVIGVPVVPAITGVVPICIGSTATLGDTAIGGSWTSVTGSIATVGSSSGTVTGVATGTDSIYYAKTNTCGTTTVGTSVSVITVPHVPAISGPDTVCLYGSITLTDSVIGGTWSNFPHTVTLSATAGSVAVTAGGAAGTALITYSVSNSCGVTAVYDTITLISEVVLSAISGPSTICVGTTTNYTDTVAGGIWAITAPSVATITPHSDTLSVRALTVGIDTISYSDSNICGVYKITSIINVIDSPVVPAISGAGTICVGSSVTLHDTATSGTWSSSAPGIASVSTSGTVNGVSFGTATITYSKMNSCGTVFKTTTIPVITAPVVPAITGTSSVCVGATFTLSDTATGGTWSSGSAGIATVSSAGLVGGVAVGTATITFSKTNMCGTTTVSTSVPVISVPILSSISGATTICTGDSVMLTDTATGGTWTSSAPGIASVSASGTVNGISAGTANISYSKTNTCGTTATSVTIPVITAPVVPAITSATTICNGDTVVLHDTATTGTWSSSTPTIATISSTGTVKGLSVGTGTISYAETNMCGTTTVAVNVPVIDVPVLSAISGTGTICRTATTLLSDTATGGTWTSASPSVASVSGTGSLTGIAVGTAIISFAKTNMCGTTTVTGTETVIDVPVVPAIVGFSSVCTGATITLTDTATGGGWSSSATSVATVTGGGVVSGVTVGTTNISYSVTNSCGTTTVSTPITVNTLPAIGSVTGIDSVCVASTITLSDTSLGGSWTSSATSVATIDAATGVVTGVSSGTATMTYSLTNVCGTVTRTFNVRVNPLPDAGTITGATTECRGTSVITLADAAGGGTWTSGTSFVATVSSSGVVTGLTGGSANIYYTVSNSCGTAADSQTVVIENPPSAGSITGFDTVCVGSTIFLSDPAGAGAGTWSSSTSAVATVSSTGVVGGVLEGSVLISYTVTNTCGAATAVHVVIVNPLPISGTISGTISICATDTAILTDGATGGTWSSTIGAIATISPFGHLFAVTSGITTISYTVTNSCGTSAATHGVTVLAQPVAGTISGTGSICPGATLTLSDTSSGGRWTSSSTSIATVDSVSGVVTGVSGGTVTISYTVTNSCNSVSATHSVTVNPAPVTGVISGPSSVCNGSSISLTDGATGGTWSSVSTSIATIDGSGNVTGVDTGTTTISYTVTNGCGTLAATKIIRVNPLPAAGTISGPTVVCAGSSIALTDIVTGGAWSSSAPATDTVNSTGHVAGITAGASTISYIYTNSCGSDTTYHSVTVNPLPFAGSISGPISVCQGATITLTDAAPGGSWSSSFTSMATVSSSGVVSGVAPGTVLIEYRVSNSCGADSAEAEVGVTALPSAGIISGHTNVCLATPDTLSSTVSGGTWSTSNSNATVSAGGIVTGLITSADTIIYTVTTTCGTAVADFPITINTLPSAGVILGTSSVCAGSSVTLSSTVSGGSWSVSNGHAGVTSGGLVSGISGGTDTVLYTVTNVCGSTSATQSETINPLPVAASISGSSNVCLGFTLSLSATLSGGTWSSGSTSIATVDASGTVYAITGGYGIISYTITNICGSAIDTFGVHVFNYPVAGTLTGPARVCTGSSATISSTAAGGSWSISNTTLATIDAGGHVYGITPGTDTIIYVVSNICGPDSAILSLPVSPAPVAGIIAGAGQVCVGSTTVDSSSVHGGRWHTSSSFISIDSVSGSISGIAAGTAIISYTVSNICGSAMATDSVIVNPLPTLSSSLVGPLICSGTTFSYTASSSSTGATYNWTRGSISGLSNAAATGTGNISEVLIDTTLSTVNVVYTYTVTSLAGCHSTPQNVTGIVNPTPALTSGLYFETCSGIPFVYNPSSTLPSTTYSWTRAAVTGIAPATGSGSSTINETLVNSTTDSATVTYVFDLSANGCSTTADVHVTVNPSETAPVITTHSPAVVCEGTNYQNFGAATTPPAGVTYTWSSNGAEIWATGSTQQYCLVNYNLPGVYQIYLTATQSGSCPARDTFTVSVNESLSQDPLVYYLNGVFVAQSGMATYQWGYDDAHTLDSTILPYETNQSYINSTPDFTSKYYWVITQYEWCMQKSYYNAPVAIQNVTMAGVKDVRVYPNPNNGSFKVNIGSDYTETGTIEVTNMVGERIMQVPCTTNRDIEMHLEQPAGIYFVNIITPHGKYVTKVAIQ